MERTVDENGRDARYEDWLESIKLDDTASDGERVTCAKALEIAADTLHRVLGDDAANKWEDTDLKLALGAIAGMRAQQGVTGPDADALGEPDGLFATKQMDIWIYG